MTAEHIALTLGGHPCKGGWMARCPAHEDHDPSCSITEVAGKVLVRCHAGCRQEDVVAALRERGLWPEPQIRSDSTRTSYGRTEHTNIERRLVAEYNYTDEAGALLYQVLRYEPGRYGKRKDFSSGTPMAVAGGSGRRARGKCSTICRK